MDYLIKQKIIKITLEDNLYMADKLDKIRENVAKNNPNLVVSGIGFGNGLASSNGNNYFNTKNISHGSILVHLIL